MEKSEELRREVDHYQAKVQSLQNERPSLFGRSKEPDPKDVERLTRNKGKLADARTLYENHVQELCEIIEEVTDRGWKNMVPILTKLGLSDQNLALNEQKCMSKLDTIINAIKDIGYGLDVNNEDTAAVSSPSLKEPVIEPSTPPPTLPSTPPPAVPPEMPPTPPLEVETISEGAVLDDVKPSSPPSTLTSPSLLPVEGFVDVTLTDNNSVPSSLPLDVGQKIEKVLDGVDVLTLEDKSASPPPVDQAIEKVSEDVVDAILENKSADLKAKGSMEAIEESQADAHSDEPKNNDVGTSFSPRSYMY